MSHQIRELYIPNTDYFEIIGAGDTPKRIANLAKINLFIGPNNSGKSRFIRELAKLHQPHFVPVVDLSPVQATREYITSKLNATIKGSIADINGYKTAAQQLGSYKSVHADQENFKDIADLSDRLAQTQTNGLNTVFSPGHFGGSSEQLVPSLREIGKNAKDLLKKALEGIPNQWEFDRIYVPTLRGLRPLKGSNDHYQERTIQDYFDSPKSLKISSGLQLFTEIRSLLLGTLTDRQVVTAFQNFLSKAFFENLPVAIIPREGKDVLYIKIGSEAEQPIYNLGDGIQMIVAIIFPLLRADTKRNVLLFVEEPELYLHPGLQRTLITAIASFPNVQCFIATHSNHLLDLTTDRDDISVFSVRKELSGEGEERNAKCYVENLSNKDTQVLNLLGVRNSSVFLSNCTIWVEGITDRRYLRHYLKLYIAQTKAQIFKEDLHYSFVEYGGSNITHWSFLDTNGDGILVDRLCARLMLVADKDDSASKDERHKKLAQKLGDRFVQLERREIENILLPDTLALVVAEYEGASDHLKKVDYSSYASEPLGTFIEKAILSEKKRKGSYAEASGTITDKILFCERAIKNMTSFDHLSPDAQKLAEQIYKFIVAHNPH